MYSQRHPSDFLSAANLANPMDRLDQREKRYNEGLKVGSTPNAVIYVGANDVWSAQWQIACTRSNCTSYEILGYHANSRYFWEGVLASGCSIVVTRLINNQLQRTVIRS